MAKTPKKITPMKKPRSPFFLFCFGVSRKEKFSGKISSSSGKVVEYSNSKIQTTTTTTTTGLFSCSMFHIMKNCSAKTVPLVTSDKSTDLSKSKIRSSLKSSSNSKSKWKIQKLFTKQINSTTKTTSFRKVPGSIVKEITEQTTQGPEQGSTLQSRKSFDIHGDTSKGATCQNRVLFRRKIEAIRTGSNEPGLSNVVFKTNPKPAKLSHSVPKQVPTHEKRANPLPKKTRRDGNVMVNKFDPVVGMSIIVVTLVIMVIWGRLCAILCTSAWLYFTPRLRALKSDDAVMKINGDLDLYSEEYKKRVVLEGFLDRDHRAVTAAVL